MNTRFKHVISLGFFCSVAQEIHDYGMRDSSYPFDWILSDFSGVVSLIENHFSHFLDFDCLYQNKNIRQQYANLDYHCYFFHDFVSNRSLKKQLSIVENKYSRRIERFYKNITEPTLFIRYIRDIDLEHFYRRLTKDEEIRVFRSKDEIKWIEENYNHIIQLIKSYNTDNEIIFIANNGTSSSIVPIFNVPIDESDYVCRYPFNKNKELQELLKSINYIGDNSLPFKNNQKLSLFKRVFRKLFTYHHAKTYE